MKIGIVLGSSRAQRLGERVCRFVLACADQVPEAEFTVFDLAGYKLPFFDEAIPPWNNPARRAAANVQLWPDDMASADGYPFVVPEYNYAVPAVVKNALDFLGHEGAANRHPSSPTPTPSTAGTSPGTSCACASTSSGCSRSPKACRWLMPIRSSTRTARWWPGRPSPGRQRGSCHGPLRNWCATRPHCVRCARTEPWPDTTAAPGKQATGATAGKGDDHAHVRQTGDRIWRGAWRALPAAAPGPRVPPAGCEPLF